MPMGIAIFQGLPVAREGMFKKAPCLTRPSRARQDVPFLWQGRRTFGAWRVQMST